MTYEEVLKLACKEARLELMHLGLVRYTWPDDGGDLAVSKIDLRDPALPAYVAELLRIEVRNRCQSFKYRETLALLLGLKENGPGGWPTDAHRSLAQTDAKPQERILAALVAMGKLTLEQAQEVEK